VELKLYGICQELKTTRPIQRYIHSICYLNTLFVNQEKAYRQERGRDTGPLTPDRRCADLAERQTCPFDWTYIHIYLNTSFSSDLPQTKALPCGARVTSSMCKSKSSRPPWPDPGCDPMGSTLLSDSQNELPI
jgi:hypothetical protein